MFKGNRHDDQQGIILQRMKPRYPKPKKRKKATHDPWAQEGQICHKIKYSNLQSAAEAAEIHGAPFSPYQCSWCSWWHLTTRASSYHNYAIGNITIIRR